MTDHIAIRQATPDDLPLLESLIEKLGHKPSGYFERCLDDQKSGGRQVFIIEQGDAVTGYGMLNWKPQYALYKRLGIPEIQDINVLPDHRRKGLATALTQYCEKSVQGKGCKQIGISVGLYKDYGPAQRLYVKLGYMPDGYGVTYDRAPVSYGALHPVDDDLCLMMVKDLT